MCACVCVCACMRGCAASHAKLIGIKVLWELLKMVHMPQLRFRVSLPIAPPLPPSPRSVTGISVRDSKIAHGR